jgi:hypothetical protein
MDLTRLCYYRRLIYGMLNEVFSGRVLAQRWVDIFHVNTRSQFGLTDKQV